MKLLITGAKGQLGRELQKILDAGRAEIGEIPAVYSNCCITCFDIEDLDLSDRQAVNEAVKDFDVIINCAAMTNVDRCEEDRKAAISGNATAAENLAAAANNIGAKLVHVSTDYVFDGKSNTPYVETDTCNPQTVYGETKRMGELAVIAGTSRFFIVRTSWLYGEFGNNFVKTILKLALERGALTVVSDQVGTPTNANDLAYHLLVLAASDNYGIYHCTGNGAECSWYDFACKIVELCKIPATVTPCTTEEFPRPAKRPAYSVLQNYCLEQLNLDKMRDWKVALADFIRKTN